MRIQNCWLFVHHNMQKSLYINAIAQNMDNIYIFIHLCTWCRSTACALQLWWKIHGRLGWLVGPTWSNSRSYCLVVMFNVKITATGCHTTAMKAFCCLQREHAKNHAPLVAFGSWLWSSWRRSRIMKLPEAICKIRKNCSRWEVARARSCTIIVAK